MRLPSRTIPSRRPVRQKLVIVGDGACGKTCLLRRFAYDEPIECVHTLTVLDNYVTHLSLPSGEQVELALWDMAGQEDYSRLRPLSYLNSDVIVIAFAVDWPDSLRNVYDMWIVEIRRFCHGIPVLLVALKTDLREDVKMLESLRAGEGWEMVTTEEGMKAAKGLGCDAYLECSSKTGEGVRQVFERAGVLALARSNGKPTRRSNGLCVIL